MRRIKASIFGVLTLAVLTQLFMNCGGGSVPSQQASASNAAQMNVAPSGIRLDTDSALVEIGGTCKAGAGDITVSGEAVGKSRVPCQGGTFMACTLLPKLGNNNVNLTQTPANGGTPATAALTINSSRRVFSEIELQINQIAILSPTLARVYIKCKPQSSIKASIYGVQQLGNEGSNCPASGLYDFNITLVDNLVGTGQRVVYVQQFQQEGKVDNVAADVDNSVAAHNCSITSGQSNTDICVAYAGTVMGTCKAGSPVRVFVNDEAEHVVECNQSGSFTALNVVLTKPGSNKINIVQKTPFNTTCTAEKNVSAFSQIN